MSSRADIAPPEYVSILGRLQDQVPTRPFLQVVAQVRPTFIHTHGAFTRAARLHEDPRFARDYVAIHESRDAPAAWRTMWPATAVLPPWSGDYVRRDAVGTSGQLDALLAEYRRQNMETFAIEPGED